MFTPSTFRDLVSGRRRGLGAAALRSALRLAEVPYTLAVSWRNRRYDRGSATSHCAGVPVVSVGNLTLGGTGKTPMVEWIARWFRARGVRVTVISRGYGARGGAAHDEALQLHQMLPDVPHLENPDRVEAARRAVEEFDCQVILLDDAFQHRRIHRDLDLVMLDALEPFGHRHVFPRGTLREPLTGLRRTHVVVLSRANLLKEPERDRVRSEVRRHAPQAAWAEIAHAPQALLSSSGRQQPLGSLERQPVASFCGIGNPAGFQHTLRQCGFRVVAFREFGDHHRYNRRDLESLARWADRQDVAAVLCTHKDLVKLSVERIGRRPLWAVAIGVDFLEGRSELESRLERFCPKSAPGR